MASRRQVGGAQDEQAPQGAPGQDGNIELGGQLPNEGAPGGFPNNGGYDPTGDHYNGPGQLPNGPETGQSSESPRDRQSGGATPRMPMSPTPAPSNTAQLQPFPPMGDTPAASMVQRRAPGSLYGSLGGLQGGGLGVPQDPVNSAQNMDISGLIQMLLKGGM